MRFRLASFPILLFLAACDRSAAPPVDILSTDSGFTIRADVPGATRDGLCLDLERRAENGCPR